MRIVLHGRAEQGFWTRIADVPYHQALSDAAALRAAVAHAKRVHFPPSSVGGGGRLLRHTDADVPSTLHLWVLSAGAALRMLPGYAGGGTRGFPDVERTLALRPEAPDDDEGSATEADAVRDVFEHARDGGLGVFLLVNMDGDDSLGVPGDQGRTIGPP